MFSLRETEKNRHCFVPLIPMQSDFLSPLSLLGLDAGAWKTAAATAITPSNFTYALHNGEKGKKKWHDGHNLPFSAYANHTDGQGQWKKLVYF